MFHLLLLLLLPALRGFLYLNILNLNVYNISVALNLHQKTKYNGTCCAGLTGLP